MNYVLENGKTVNIPDKEIDTLVEKLDISISEAIECWLEDNDLVELDEESQALQDKAKNVKVDHGVAYKKGEKKAPKPKVVTDTKKLLFQTIWEVVHQEYGDGAVIRTDNKYIDVKSGGYSYTINLVEHRKPKK